MSDRKIDDRTAVIAPRMDRVLQACDELGLDRKRTLKITPNTGHAGRGCIIDRVILVDDVQLTQQMRESLIPSLYKISPPQIFRWTRSFL